jgi:hypothetical protein
LTLARVSENDRRTIIWNFMEELWENYLNARENNLSNAFNLLVFFNFGILKDGFTENDKLSVIKGYAKKKGFIKIVGIEVHITKKGLKKFQKNIHDWDTPTEVNFVKFFTIRNPNITSNSSSLNPSYSTL